MSLYFAGHRVLIDTWEFYYIFLCCSAIFLVVVIMLYVIWVNRRWWDGKDDFRMLLVYVGMCFLVFGAVVWVVDMLYGATVWMSLTKMLSTAFHCILVPVLVFTGIRILWLRVAGVSLFSRAIGVIQWLCRRWPGFLSYLGVSVFVCLVLVCAIWCLMSLCQCDPVHNLRFFGFFSATSPAPVGSVWQFSRKECLYGLAEVLLGFCVVYVCYGHYMRLYDLYDDLYPYASELGWFFVVFDYLQQAPLVLPDVIAYGGLSLAFVGRVGYRVASFVCGW